MTRQTPRATLFEALHRTYFGSMLLALLIAALALAAVAFFTLRAQHAANLALVARTIAYSSEAATMFADATTATEILQQIGKAEQLVEARILLPDGQELARYQQLGAALENLSAFIGQLAEPRRFTADIAMGDKVLGQVVVRGNGSIFAAFFLKAVAVGLLGLAAALFSARHRARRLERKLATEMEALSSIARAARTQGDFARRMPQFGVVEFDELGKDFNALFDELEARNAELVARQASLEQANASLSHMALHDTLTGLANRAYFHECLDEAVAKARRHGTRLGVLYVNNDRFKEINDTYGHAAGDTLLVEVARRLRAAVRESDLVARLGGDEFAVLLTPLHGEEDACRVAEKILAAVATPITLGPGVDAVPGLSIGIALWPQHAGQGEALLRAADNAMYLAKRNGRGQYRVAPELAESGEEP